MFHLDFYMMQFGGYLDEMAFDISMRFRKSAHAIYKTKYHLVWIPGYQRKIFTKGVKEYTEKILSNIPELYPDIEVVKLNVQEDHVRMVVVIPPRIAIANAIQYIKTQSAKKLNAKFPFMQKTYARKGGIWSRGYCVSCIGLNEKEILNYVEHQEKEDRGKLQLTLP